MSRGLDPILPDGLVLGNPLLCNLLDTPAFALDSVGCYTDPQWGTNPDETYDCGEGPGRIVKIAWPGMKDKWPAAYQLLKEFKISNEEDMEIPTACMSRR